MKAAGLIFVFALVLPGLVAEGWSAGTIDIDRLSELSQVGYSVQYGGWHVGAEDPPQLYQYSLVCKKGTVHAVFANVWLDGRREESRRVVSFSDYKGLWEVLEELDIWNLKTIDLETLRPDDDESDPYENCPTEGSDYEFFLNIGERSHEFKAYEIEGLKDKRYLRIRKEIDRFFGFLKAGEEEVDRTGDGA